MRCQIQINSSNRGVNQKFKELKRYVGTYTVNSKFQSNVLEGSLIKLVEKPKVFQFGIFQKRYFELDFDQAQFTIRNLKKDKMTKIPFRSIVECHEGMDGPELKELIIKNLKHLGQWHHVFMIKTNERSYFLFAPTQIEQRMWTAGFQYAIVTRIAIQKIIEQENKKIPKQIMIRSKSEPKNAHDKKEPKLNIDIDNKYDNQWKQYDKDVVSKSAKFAQISTDIAKNLIKQKIRHFFSEQRISEPQKIEEEEKESELFQIVNAMDPENIKEMIKPKEEKAKIIKSRNQIQKYKSQEQIEKRQEQIQEQLAELQMQKQILESMKMHNKEPEKETIHKHQIGATSLSRKRRIQNKQIIFEKPKAAPQEIQKTRKIDKIQRIQKSQSQILKVENDFQLQIEPTQTQNLGKFEKNVRTRNHKIKEASTMKKVEQKRTLKIRYLSNEKRRNSQRIFEKRDSIPKFKFTFKKDSQQNQENKIEPSGWFTQRKREHSKNRESPYLTYKNSPEVKKEKEKKIIFKKAKKVEIQINLSKSRNQQLQSGGCSLQNSPRYFIFNTQQEQKQKFFKKDSEQGAQQSKASFWNNCYEN